MSGAKFCAVCKTISSFSLIKFPADEEVRQKWIDKTGVTPKNETDTQTRICRHAPVPEYTVPPALSGKRKTTRCAVCNVSCRVESTVAIFDKKGIAFTDFGVSLNLLLQLSSSREVVSRHCCLDCSQTVIKCFELMVDLNVSTLLTKRMLAARQIKEEEEEAMERTPMSCVKELKKLDDLGDCPKCDGVLQTLGKFSDHFLTHIFYDNQHVIRKSVAITQTDEIDMEMGFCEEINEDDEDEQSTKKRRGRPKKKEARKRKAAEHEANYDDYIVEYLEEDTKDGMMAEEVGSHEPIAPKTSEEKVKVELEETEQMLSANDIFEDAQASDIAIQMLDEQLQNFEGEEGFELHERRENDGAEDEAAGKEKKKKKKQTGTNSGPRVCHICGAILKHLKSYMSHMELHNNPMKNYKACELCGQVRGNMSQHKKTCQKQMARAGQERERKTPSSTCGICGKVFAEVYLPRHLLIHEIEDDVSRNGHQVLDKYMQSCPICGKRVKHIPIHMKKSHKMDAAQQIAIDAKDSVAQFNCERCGQFFMQRPMFVFHLVLKHGLDPRHLSSRGSWSLRTPWTCAVCNEVYMTYDLIRRHTKEAHNGIGLNLECEACNKRYNCLRSLRAHVNMKHINYYKYRCDVCDLYFVKEESIKEHYANKCKANGGASVKKRPRKQTENSSYMAKNLIFEPVSVFEPYNELVIEEVKCTDDVFYIAE